MYTHIAKQGKFKVMLVEFTNSNESDFEIDFKNVFLIDNNNNNRYRVSSVAQAYLPHLSNSQYKVTLRPDKTKLYFAQFRPPFPKKEKIERIEVNGEIIILNEPK